MFFSDCPKQLFQIFSVKNAVFKYKAGNDHMRSSGFQKIFRIFIGNAASDLQSSWIRPKCQHGLLFCFFIKRRIFCIQQNHMSAAYPVFLILITILVGIVTIALGNILPGRLGDFFPDQTASLLTPFMMVMSILLRPIVWLTLGIANLGLRLLGQNPNQEPDTVTEEEIRMMVTVGEEKGAIEQSEKDMINNIFEFDDRVVTEVMTHRMEMIALKDTVQLDEAVKVARETGYSRIPVYHEDIDYIVGCLYAKELLHEPFYIPETAKCTELFKDFQRKQLHMAIVIDEYGGTYGMVTMEDLLETIVGNIQDEYDKEENEYQKLSDTEYTIDGWISVDEVEDLLGIKIPDDTEYDTLGGVVVDMLGDLPEEGQHPSVQIDRVRFTVLEVDDRRISRLKAEILPDESCPEPGERRD